MNYQKITEHAFLDELEKIGGIGSFLGGGLKGLGQLATGKAGLSSVGRLGRMAYGQGARTGGMWGGIKGLAKSQVGQMAAIPALAAGGLYAGHKLLSRPQQEQ